MSPFPSRHGFSMRSIFWHLRPKESQANRCHMPLVWIYNADGARCSTPWMAPVIFHRLLNCSSTVQVWVFHSPPSVASPATTKKAFSSVTVLQSMPSTWNLRKFVMTYQMTACKYFRKWSKYYKKYMISHLTFPQTVRMILFGFHSDIFGQCCRILWVMVYYIFLLYISPQLFQLSCLPKRKIHF